jgi:adenine phosphoribosyltransferase
VLIIDDLLATGGTAAAAASLIEGRGARLVGAAFVVELLALNGRRLLKGTEITSLVQY